MEKINIHKLNKAQICSIKSFINAFNTTYVYKTYRRGIFLIRNERKEGFYKKNILSDDEYIGTAIDIEDSRYFCKDGKVYYFPHLEVRMSNQSVHEVFFKTPDELTDFVNSELKDVNWINRDWK